MSVYTVELQLFMDIYMSFILWNMSRIWWIQHVHIYNRILKFEYFVFLKANQPTSGPAATDGPAKVKEKEKEEIDEKQEKEEPLDKEALDSFTNSVVTGKFV